MKRGNMRHTGWACVLVCSHLLLVGSLRAAEPFDEIIDLTNQLEALREQADILLDQVRGVTDPGELPPLWAQALAFEEQAVPISQQGIDVAQTVADPSELFKKRIIIFEHFHVKLIKTITIIKLTILQFEIEFAVPQGPPEPEIDQIIALFGELRTMKGDAETLVSQIEVATDPGELPGLWAQALLLEEQALVVVQEGLGIAQSVGDPTMLLKKKIIIFEHWHVKVIDVICVAKILILRLQEEFKNPVPPPDQPVIDQVVDLTTQLKGLDAQADALIDQIALVTLPSELPPLWAQALLLEEQSLPIVQQGIDAIQTVPVPSERLVKSVVIFEVRFEILIMEICICKVMVIQLEEEFEVPQAPPEPEIAEVIALAGDLENLDDQSHTLIDQIRGTSTTEELHPLWAEAIALEEMALPIMQQGIDIAQAVQGDHEPTELLKTKIIILEVWSARVVTEICIAKLIILQRREEFPIPTVSEWGMAVMVLLVLAAGTVVFRRYRVAAA